MLCSLKILYATAVATLLTACAQQPRIEFGYLDRHPAGGFHTGIDLSGSIGQGVYAARAGRVIWAQHNDGAVAARILIEHEWQGLVYTTNYYHIADPLVSTGDLVEQGQLIARLALTGFMGPNDARTIWWPHLHLEVTVDGLRRDPERAVVWRCPDPNTKVAWTWPIGCGRR